MSSNSSIRLKEISNYKTGGDCLYFFEPHSKEELQDNLREIHKKKMPAFFLGGGTNSLVLDEYWNGAVLSFRNLNEIKFEADRVHCGAGVVNSDLSEQALKYGLSGLEWMFSLPGQLGGTIRMNARCYGGEISQVVEKVYGYTLKGEEKIYELLKPGDKKIFRGYKDTIFMQNNVVVASAVLKLDAGGDPVTMQEKMSFCKSDRETKGHFEFPSCGCVFKNNYDPEISVPSGMLLDHVGAKTLSKGKAQVSSKHANFIYNTGGASSRDILELALVMREKVWGVFGVWLEFEMEILGDLPADLKKAVWEQREHRYNKTLLTEMRAKFGGRPRTY